MNQADPLIPVLAAAHCAGNPVPGGDPQHWPQIVRSVRRRWASFRHRHPAPEPDTRSARVEDLARGLLVRCSARGKGLIEISDCRALADRLAQQLEPSPDASSGTHAPAGESR